MAAACRWGVDSGKLVYPSTFEHVPTFVCVNYRPSKSFVPKQQRKQYVSVVYYWRKNEWQEYGAADRIEFCVKIGKSVSQTVALLTLAYCEYAVKKWSVFEWHWQLKEGRDDVQDDPRSASKKRQRTVANVDRVRTLVRSDRRLAVRLIAEVYGNLSGGKYLNSGRISRFSTMTMLLHVMH
jgi:hypothetical protein